MISVVCVYNDRDKLERRLSSSLRAQTARHQCIVVDNTDSRFPSAAAALNWAARGAAGDWLLFVHQDVALLSNEWLDKAEGMLRRYQPAGWTGVVGMTDAGELRGFLLDRARVLGRPFGAPVEVQTLDEVVLMHRRDAGHSRYFDEGLTGWHAYGVDACCRARQVGHKNYVISLPVWHDSQSTNRQGLEDAHAYVWRKHGRALSRIFTMYGALPERYRWDGRQETIPVLTQFGRKLCATIFSAHGFRVVYDWTFLNVLESLTEGLSDVEVAHTPGPYDTLETRSFVARPKTARRVTHRFGGLDDDVLRSSHVVIMPDLAAQLLDDATALDAVVNPPRSTIVCVNLRQLVSRPGLWRGAGRSDSDRLLYLKEDAITNWDGMARAIAVLSFGPLRRGARAA